MSVAGVVCEGHSDFAILADVIYKLWPEIEDVLLIQPILDSIGHAQGASGASGVKAWCTENSGALDAVIDPGVGPKLDLLVIAMDADAAISAGIDDPPARASAYDASRLCAKIRGWLGTLPPELVIAIPAMSIEAWVVGARFEKPKNPEKLLNPAKTLADKNLLEYDTRPKRGHKVVKPPSTYRTFAAQVAAKLPRVRKRCDEADRFAKKVIQVRDR